VLGLMAAIFAATDAAPDTTIVRLFRSMAEAGMLGVVADWFAVEALFRHALGLPILQTALLPKNAGPRREERQPLLRGPRSPVPCVQTWPPHLTSL
jgi:hypothetical protein